MIKNPTVQKANSEVRSAQSARPEAKKTKQNGKSGKKTRFSAKSAGGVSISEYLAVSPNDTIATILDQIKQKINWLQTINYVYVTDDEGGLVGVLSIKELFRKEPATVVSKVMNREIISVKPTASRERVAYLALKHSIKEIPVLDGEHKVIGVIPSDRIYSIAYKEAREDLMKFAGYRGNNTNLDDVMKLPLFTALLHRLPWLFIALFGGLVAAQIINVFSPTLEKSIILASFIPLATNITGAVGTQVQVFMVRDLLTRPRLNFSKYFMKQLNTVTLTALIISLTFFGVSYLIYGNPLNSYAIGVALFCSINSSLFTGLFIPYMFNKLKIDPANASGPVGTIIQDVTTVLIYFVVVAALL